MRDRLDLSPEQRRAFESPVRASLLMTLRAHQALTTREIGERLGLAPTSLYHHIRLLLRVGLIQIREHRPAETRPEAVYEPAAREFYLDEGPLDTEAHASLFRTTRGVLKGALRHYEAALPALPDDPETATYVRLNLASARMRPETASAFKAEMRDLFRRMLQTNDPDGRPVLVVALMVPTEGGVADD